jgi:hypothetical protein
MNLVDVAIENNEGNYYQFLYVSEQVLREAVSRSVSDSGALSMVSSDNSAAIVVPWHSIRKVLFIDVQSEARAGNEWTTLWDRDNVQSAPKKSKRTRKQKKVEHG